MTPKELLKQARAKIVGSTWIQGTYAMDDVGEECLPDDSKAVGFCVYGALYSVLGTHADDEADTPEELVSALHRLRVAIAGSESPDILDRLFLADWNDLPKRTEEEVLAAFDKAIESVEAAT